MKAWSLAWNFAEIELDDNTIRIIQVRRTGKGCLSYIVGSGDATVVIDPSVSANVNVDLVRHRGWTVRYVLETHIHADHLSRASEVLPRRLPRFCYQRSSARSFPSQQWQTAIASLWAVRLSKPNRRPATQTRAWRSF